MKQTDKPQYDALWSEIHESMIIRECVYCGFVIMKGIEYYKSPDGDCCLRHVTIKTIEEMRDGKN